MPRTLAYLTDIHLDEADLTEMGVNARNNWQRILADVQARGIRSIVFGGDIGEAAANAWFFDSLKDVDLQLTLGNHDTFANARQHFDKKEWKDKAEAYYSLEDAHFKYLFLDSSTNTVSVTQRLWLTQEVTTSKPVLLFIHHPIFPVDTPIDRAYPLQGREHLQQLLLQRKAPTTIFCGHYHMPDEQTRGSIQQLVTPAASFQLVKEAMDIQTDPTWFGYRIVHLDANTIHTQVVTFDRQ